MTTKTIIWRHRRENLAKCSLRGLESHPLFQFFTYPKEPLPSLSNYVLLSLDGPLLSPADADKGLFLIDATWRHAATMERALQQPLERRTLPSSFFTAYPRRQDDCQDKERGLASVEALYIAHHLLGRSVEGILDHYHWEEEFIKKNGL